MKLVWDITNKCNLKCKHCGAVKLTNENETINKDWRKIIDYCKDFVDCISLLGGEPLLYPEIEKVIEYANLNGMDVFLITNGQSDIKKLDNIMKHDISSIMVSIDGLEETNDKIRGIGSWKKAMNSLNHLVNINKNKVRKTLLGVNIVINKLNSNEIIDFIESTKNLDIIYQLNNLAITGNAIINKEMFKMKSYELLNFFEKLAEYHINNSYLKINFLDNYPIVNEYLNRKCGTNYKIQEKACDVMTNSIYADPYGNIKTCYNNNDIILKITDDSSWKDDFSQFEPFLEILHEKNENTTCSMCKHKDICKPCPLKTDFKVPSICTEVMKRNKDLALPLDAEFKLDKPYSIIKSKDRYEVFYPNLGLNTEYTIEGIKILDAITDYKTLRDISEEVSFPPEVIYEFLLQEKAAHKIVEKRK